MNVVVDSGMMMKTVKVLKYYYCWILKEEQKIVCCCLQKKKALDDEFEIFLMIIDSTNYFVEYNTDVMIQERTVEFYIENCTKTKKKTSFIEKKV